MSAGAYGLADSFQIIIIIIIKKKRTCSGCVAECSAECRLHLKWSDKLCFKFSLLPALTLVWKVFSHLDHFLPLQTSLGLKTKPPLSPQGDLVQRFAQTQRGKDWRGHYCVWSSVPAAAVSESRSRSPGQRSKPNTQRMSPAPQRLNCFSPGLSLNIRCFRLLLGFQSLCEKICPSTVVNMFYTTIK